MSLSSPASAAPATQHRSLGWTVAVFLVSAPVLVSLFLVLWRTPYPISEAVALFEDAARAQSVDRFLTPDTSYYRPLYHLSLMAVWHRLGPLETRLMAVKLLHFLPMAFLVLSFIWHMRPRT